MHVEATSPPFALIPDRRPEPPAGPDSFSTSSVGEAVGRAIGRVTEHGAPCATADSPPRRASFDGADLFWLAFAGLVSACVLLVLTPNRARIRQAETEVRLLSQEITSLGERAAHLRSWERALNADDPSAWTAIARSRLRPPALSSAPARTRTLP